MAPDEGAALKLRAEDTEDLAVISACLQDALVSVRDLAYDRASRYEDAIRALKRVVQLSEPRLVGPDGRPTFDLKFYAVNKRGEFGAASFYPAPYAAHDGVEAKLRDMAHLYERPAASR